MAGTVDWSTTVLVHMFAQYIKKLRAEHTYTEEANTVAAQCVFSDANKHWTKTNWQWPPSI